MASDFSQFVEFDRAFESHTKNVGIGDEKATSIFNIATHAPAHNQIIRFKLH